MADDDADQLATPRKAMKPNGVCMSAKAINAAMAP